MAQLPHSLRRSDGGSVTEILKYFCLAETHRASPYILATVCRLSIHLSVWMNL
jgi:hypothetical protein